MWIGRKDCLALATVAALTFALPTAAQESTPDWLHMQAADFFGASVKPLAILFVLAILLESALSVIFNWRLFLQLFYGRGVRTLVMIAVSALVVWTFNVDVIFKMMQAYGLTQADQDHTTLSRWLTALILAGGSAGVYNILVALGYRDPRPEDAIKKKPPSGKAWISVGVTRNRAVGPIRIDLAQIPDDPAAPIVAGNIVPEGFWRTVWSVFFLDKNRWPQAAGREVESGKTYQLSVVAEDAAGNLIASKLDSTYRFADGAIVDFKAVL